MAARAVPKPSAYRLILMGDRHDSVVASDEETGSTGTATQVGTMKSPAVKNSRIRPVWLLTQGRLMGVPYYCRAIMPYAFFPAAQCING